MVLLGIRAAVSLLALISVMPGVDGYYEYQARIPNGERVPHPCNANVLWHGVGHFNVQGGGPRNQFGLDFVAAGRTWTAELCRKDSDGDGKSNGEELGDPQCIWTPGQVPQFTSGITHPGVCDPFREAVCSSKAVPYSAGLSYTTVGEWMKEACDRAEFRCPAIDGEDVQQLDLRIPAMPVPAKDTTYMCMTFEWPDVTQDFHVIATEPIINNSNILHHMLLLGCPDDYPVAQSPWECSMDVCRDLVSSWGVGLLGHCFHQDAGIHVGRTGYRKFTIQLHWNNPHLHSHFTDSSGMTLYYTSRLRPYNMAMLWTGQNFIHIPPKSPDTFVTSDCTSACTRTLMTGDIKITTALNHMHYLGKSMNIELHRCGRFLMNLTNELTYSYDSPKVYEYPDVVTVKPGDMIRTNCHFSSVNKTSSTFFGLSTSDEMCYGFLSFYPKENMPTSTFCTSWKGYLQCDQTTYRGCSKQDRSIFSSPSFNQTDIFRNITSFCQFGLCTEECKRAIRTVRKCDPCLSNGDMWDIIRSYHLSASEAGWYFSASMATCEKELYSESLTHPHLSDSITCPQGQTPDLTPQPVYNDTCDKEPLRSVSAAQSSSGAAAVFVALVSGTLYLTVLSH